MLLITQTRNSSAFELARIQLSSATTNAVGGGEKKRKLNVRVTKEKSGIDAPHDLCPLLSPSRSYLTSSAGLVETLW